jgi:MarR family transcriptional regulator, lower aerobic nicotinate degradation pathway regulator
VDDSGYEIGFLLRRANVRSLAAFKAALAPLGIEPRHFAVLHELADTPHSQRRLVDLVGSDKSAMVRLIDDLERAGLVNRQMSLQDRRVQVITLTDKGTATVRAAQDNATDVAAGLTEHMSPASRQQLADLLREFVAGPGDGSAKC